MYISKRLISKDQFRKHLCDYIKGHELIQLSALLDGLYSRIGSDHLSFIDQCRIRYRVFHCILTAMDRGDLICKAVPYEYVELKPPSLH